MSEVQVQTQVPEELDNAQWDEVYRYGWRYVAQKDEDGNETWVQQPLTEEDVLHPQEGDFIVQTDYHVENVGTLGHALEAVFGYSVIGGQGPTMVRIDGRTNFQVVGVNPMGPDLGIFCNLNQPFERGSGTFNVKDYDAEIVAVIEVTSPSTRNKDLREKPALYFQAGVPILIIVDYDPVLAEQGQHVIHVKGFRATPTGYVAMPLDARGRLWVDELHLWIAPEGGRVVCYDAKDNRFPVYSELLALKEAETKRANDEAKARKKAEDRAADEAKARKKAAARLADEAKARKKAEDLAADEAKARKASEDKLASLLAALAGLPAEKRGPDFEALLAQFQPPGRAESL